MLKAIARVLFWTYPRGSWQYDLMCIGIILFIFLTPRWVFDHTHPEHPPDQVEEAQHQDTIPQAEAPTSETPELAEDSSSDLVRASDQSP